MIRFYSPDIELTGTLPEDESTHCCRVLRMREGAEIETVDGEGHVYRCIITDAHPKHTGVEIIERKDQSQNWQGSLTLAVAPTKNSDRMEWLVEKAVEMGVNEIVLLRCEHSERRKMNTDRLVRIAVSAMKQSLKARLPIVTGLVNYKDFINEHTGNSEFRCFGYCSPEVERRDFGQSCPKCSDVVVMIGPEGDFSASEVSGAIDAGFHPVTFGTSRLRTETAALYATAAFHVINNM